MSLLQRDATMAGSGDIRASPTGGPGSIESSLACNHCRKRKIKCCRQLPACQNCARFKKLCLYPRTSLRPGPKPGFPQKRGRRIVDVEPQGEEARFANYQSKQARCVHNKCNEGTTAIPRTPQSDHEHQHLVEPEVRRSGTPGTHALSLLLHPCHDEMPDTPRGNRAQEFDHDTSNQDVVSSACEAFKISPDVYYLLLDGYFDKMTAFSLFHRPTFNWKLNSILDRGQCNALLAAMFSFSSRFQASKSAGVPNHDYFFDLGQSLGSDALKYCAEDVPSLCVLQAMILITYQQLIKSVRGRSWRSLGNCIRVAYELQLHIIDKGVKSIKPACDRFRDEESRRAWWAVWECDVFASTIRRLPSGIDWQNNETLLPMSDEIWFDNASATSSLLNADAAQAWKDLQKSGNKSAKAWFIVTNALMRCAHLLSYQYSYAAKSSQNQVAPDTVRSDGLHILANSLYCLSSAIPSELVYKGEFLDFLPTRAGLIGTIQHDSDTYSIHIMIQLSRFMINHYQVFSNAPHMVGTRRSQHIPALNSLRSLDQPAWTAFLAAASEIVRMIRNCPPDHIRYVNPFLSNTIWLAAAAQIVSRYSQIFFFDKRAAESNLDLLQINLNAYSSFWAVSNSLQQRLVALDSTLNNKDNENSRLSLGGQIQSGRPPCFENQHEPNLQHGHQREILALQRPNAVTPSGSHASLIERNPASSWNTQQPSDWSNPVMSQGVDSALWAWELDELLVYGGLE